MQKFYNNAGPEDTLMDPLILAGERVVPLVLDKVKDKNMPRRRYAISFLGNGAYKQALPALEGVLQDSTEQDYFRGDALRSIYQIDQSQGMRYAGTYKDEPGNLGKVSRDILAGEQHLLERRSYLDAWLGRHS